MTAMQDEVHDNLEEGGYSAQCLELPGCISEGETREEALKKHKRGN
jgi:predicted RNase H-like HicB family nuclease